MEEQFVLHYPSSPLPHTPRALGLYIHIPFCRSRCHFCAFYLQIYREDRAHNYLTALSREIQLHAEQQTLGGRPLQTVYFGGGTPTTLQASELCNILLRVQEQFGLQPDAEITVEAHPDTATIDGLSQLAHAGFNRISFGVQSLEDDELAAMGRATYPGAIGSAVASAREAGFSNINLDLIFGSSGQNLENWQSNITRALALNPTHLSCYALTVEEDTRLIVDIHRGDRMNPEEVLQNAMEDAAIDELTAAGFHRYEISNYCRPGYACRHNRLYWEGNDYLGIGPSAQSYVNGTRFGNIGDLKDYQDMLVQERLPIAEREQLSPEQRHREAIVFGLRLTEGINIDSIHSQELNADWEDRIARLLQEGWLEETDRRIRLTATGRRFADSVAVALL